MKIRKLVNLRRLRRKIRVRRQVRGSARRPRLSLFRSHRYTYVQLIDDAKGVTLASVSTGHLKKKTKKAEAAREIGKIIAEKAKKLGVERAVFDRGSYKYHGRVKMMVEAAREAGLKI